MSQDRFLESGEPSPDDINVPDVVDFEARGLDLPAPEIDLGGGPAEAADKPLGPRRLALLREQMEQHAQEVAAGQSNDPEYVDEELAQKQRRMAELASRAGLSSEEDRATAERAMAASSEGEASDSQPMTSSIPAGQTRRRDLRVKQEAEGAVEEAPEEEGSATGESGPGSDAVSAPGADPAVEPESEGPESAAETATETETETEAAAESAVDPATESQVAQSEAAAAPESVEEEPGQPVSALDAQGLDLLDPSEYRQSSPAKAILLVLAAVVLLAVAVVVLMILL